MIYVFRARKYSAANANYYGFSHWCHYRKKKKRKKHLTSGNDGLYLNQTQQFHNLTVICTYHNKQILNRLKKNHIKNGSSKETIQPDLSILSESRELKKRVRFWVFLIHFKYDLITILKAAHKNRFSFFSSPITIVHDDDDHHHRPAEFDFVFFFFIFKIPNKWIVRCALCVRCPMSSAQAIIILCLRPLSTLADSYKNRAAKIIYCYFIIKYVREH